MKRIIFALSLVLVFTIPILAQDYSRIDRTLSTVEIDQVVKDSGTVVNAHVIVHIVDIDGNVYDGEWWVGTGITAAVVNRTLTKNEVLVQQGKRGYNALHEQLNPPAATTPETASGALSGSSPFGNSDISTHGGTLDDKIAAKQAEIASAQTTVTLAQSALAALEADLADLISAKNQ